MFDVALICLAFGTPLIELLILLLASPKCIEVTTVHGDPLRAEPPPPPGEPGNLEKSPSGTWGPTMPPWDASPNEPLDLDPQRRLAVKIDRGKPAV